MQNFEIYIGNDPDYLQNSKCPGGPFMKVGDPKSYSAAQLGTPSNPIGQTTMWNYGVEAWCNLEG